MSKEQDFIDKIAPYHIKYAQKYGFKIASAGIAQACLESGYGTSYKAQFNNYHGLKYRKNRVNCNNGYFIDGGSEQNANGSYTMLPSDTAWYRFDDMEHAVEGYYQFINTPSYAKVKEATNPLTYLQEIKKVGYASSLKYVENVYKVLQNNHLDKYDNFSSQQQTTKANNKDLKVILKPNSHNTSTQPNRKIEWIVLHYTAGIASGRGTAQNTASYFATTQNEASADFIVDDAEIVQYNPDPTNRYCWAVGGKKYTSLSNSLAGKYHGQCRNNNSISIEMCSRKKNTATLNATDDDWYLTQETINNTVKLTKYLMKEYNINIDHVIMHNMVTGKWCPQPWSKNEQALQNWYNFINQVKGAAGTTSQPTSNITQVQSPAAFNSYKIKVTASALNVRTGPGTKYIVITTIRDKGIYTIVDEENGWGLLKSFQKQRDGWISLKYTKKI